VTEQPPEEPTSADSAGTEPDGAERPDVAAESGEESLGGWDEPEVAEGTWLPIEIETEEVIIEVTDVVVAEEPADPPAVPDASMSEPSPAVASDTEAAVEPPPASPSARMTGWRPFKSAGAGGESPVPRRPSVLQHSNFSTPPSSPPPPPMRPHTPAGAKRSPFPARKPASGPAASPQPAGSPTSVADKLATLRSQLAELSSDRPEVVIGAAFVGGLILASILKRLAR
jgi:hypothetical protein